MQYQELLTYKKKIMILFNAYGVENPRVFGSTVHGNSTPKSDIDFLVSWPVRHSLFDRIRLKRELETLLNRKVDLVTDKSLYPAIRAEVIRAAKPL